VSLREADYRGILSFLDDLEMANDLDSFMTTSVGRLHDLVAADVITFHDLDFVYSSPAHPRVTQVRAYHEFPEWPLLPDQEEMEAACRDAYPLCWTHDYQPTVRRLSDVIDRPTLRRNDFYQGLMHPAGQEYDAKTTLPSPRGVCTAFVLSRETRDFSDRDTLVLEAVIPHLTYALRRVRDHERAAEIAATLEGVTASVGLGVLVLGPGDRIEATIGRGRDLVERYLGANGHVPEPVASWLHEQRSRVRAPEIGAPPEPLVIERGETRLTMRYIARTATESVLLEEGGPRRLEPDPELGLTARETEVLRLVGRGLTNKQAARMLGVSVSTVRKHLENTYAKLEVGTRTAALARAFRAGT
jgi:DNA-binding CsgD family transcriptional regulator